MKVLKMTWVLLFAFGCVQLSFAQAPQWINYTNGDEIYALADDGNYLWVGTRSGLVKIDKISGETSYYDKWNSGLTNNHMRRLTVDKDGHIWIVTINGLEVFDGTNWIAFDKTNSRLPDCCINCMVVDNLNIKWIGTDEGLVKYDGDTWTVYDTNNSNIPSDHIKCMAIDSLGKIWAGTDKELAYFDDLDWTVFDDTEVYDIDGIAVDGLGNIWIVDGRDLIKCDSKLEEVNRWVDHIFQYGFGSFYVDPSGCLWFSNGCDLVKAEGPYWSGMSDIPCSNINCFIVDETSIWLAASVPKYCIFDGLLKYDQSREWIKINTSSSPLPKPAVNGIEIDKTGNKWLNCGIGWCWPSERLVQIDGEKWTIFDSTNSGLSNYVSTFCIEIDALNQKWIGTSEGLTLFDGINWTNYEIWNTELPYNSLAANCIAIDDHGVKWIGTSGGLMKFDGYKWEMFNKYNSNLPCDIITLITIDDADNKWIVMDSDCYDKAGLVKYNGETWEVFNTDNSGLPHNFISCIAIDSMNNKWIGTNESGLVKYDDNEWTIYNESNSQLHSNYISCIRIDKNNVKWIGTYSGLAKFDDESWTIYTEENSGLVDNWVRSIAVDNASNIWIGTTFGLSVFNENGISSNDDLFLKNTIVPIEYLLSQNYPNPFNPKTTIAYSVRAQRAVPQQINLSVYDLLGQKVATLVNKKQPAGSYQVQWDATGFATGVYYYKIEAGEYSEVKKMILIR